MKGQAGNEMKKVLKTEIAEIEDKKGFNYFSVFIKKLSRMLLIVVFLLQLIMLYGQIG